MTHLQLHSAALQYFFMSGEMARSELSRPTYLVLLRLEDASSKEDQRKAREELLKSAQVRVQAYRLGTEQREMQEMRLRSEGTRERKKRDNTRKVSFNLT